MPPEGKLGDLAGRISASFEGEALLSTKDAFGRRWRSPHVHPERPAHTYTPTKACTHEDTPQARPQQLSSWWGHPHACVSVCACVCVCARGPMWCAHQVSVSSASVPGRKQEEEEGQKPSGPV